MREKARGKDNVIKGQEVRQKFRIEVQCLVWIQAEVCYEKQSSTARVMYVQ